VRNNDVPACYMPGRQSLPRPPQYPATQVGLALHASSTAHACSLLLWVHIWVCWCTY